MITRLPIVDNLLKTIEKTCKIETLTPAARPRQELTHRVIRIEDKEKPSDERILFIVEEMAKATLVNIYDGSIVSFTNYATAMHKSVCASSKFNTEAACCYIATCFVASVHVNDNKPKEKLYIPYSNGEQALEKSSHFVLPDFSLQVFHDNITIKFEKLDKKAVGSFRTKASKVFNMVDTMHFDWAISDLSSVDDEEDIYIF